MNFADEGRNRLFFKAMLWCSLVFFNCVFLVFLKKMHSPGYLRRERFLALQGLLLGPLGRFQTPVQVVHVAGRLKNLAALLGFQRRLLGLGLRFLQIPHLPGQLPFPLLQAAQVALCETKTPGTSLTRLLVELL